MAGYSANQLAAVIGLMGAAIGYVIGKEQRQTPNDGTSPPSTPPAPPPS